MALAAKGTPITARLDTDVLCLLILKQPGIGLSYTCRCLPFVVGALLTDTLNPAAKKIRNRSVLLLVVGATGAVLFICAAAVIFYRNTQRLLASRVLEGHSQDVLSRLQTESARLERMDYLTRIYLAERNADDKNTIQTTEGVLNSNLSDLEKLIWDTKQRDRARFARACTDELIRQVNALVANSQSGAIERAALTRKMLECRDLVDRMETEEQLLLKQRSIDADQRAYRNLLTGGLFLLVSLFTVLSLFGFLLRDVWKHAKSEAQIFNTNERLNGTIQELKNQTAELSLITSMRQELQLCTTPDEAHRTTVCYVAKALPKAKIALMKVDSARRMMQIAATSDDQTQILDEFPVGACCGLRAGRPRRHKAGESEIECRHFAGKPPEDYLCMPFVAHGETLGLLYIGCQGTEDAEDLDLHHRLLERASDVASVWIASLNLRAQLEEQSIRDGLTNLYNRRFMEMALDREALLAIRRKTDLSVLMMDIDHFKRFNDTFGHEAGDQVLRGVAEILRHGVRAEDIACRYGGEELLLILPGTGAEVARERAEELRRRISEMQLDIPGSGSKKVTVSIGVATFPQAGQTAEDLVRSADRALYLAKNNGRDRVEKAETMVAG